MAASQEEEPAPGSAGSTAQARIARVRCGSDPSGYRFRYSTAGMGAVAGTRQQRSLSGPEAGGEPMSPGAKSASSSELGANLGSRGGHDLGVVLRRDAAQPSGRSGHLSQPTSVEGILMGEGPAVIRRAAGNAL